MLIGLSGGSVYIAVEKVLDVFKCMKVDKSLGPDPVYIQ